MFLKAKLCIVSKKPTVKRVLFQLNSHIIVKRIAKYKKCFTDVKRIFPYSILLHQNKKVHFCYFEKIDFKDL